MSITPRNSRSLRLAFLVSAGKTTGFGHVRRCLSLAEELARLGVECSFVLDYDERETRSIDIPFPKMDSVPADVPLIVDSYRIVRQSLAAIDDVPARDLPASIIVNGSIGAEKAVTMRREGVTYLLGCRYALLRSEFTGLPVREVRAKIRRVLVTTGGSDPHHLTPRLVQWAAEAIGGVDIDVIIGPMFDAAMVSSSERIFVHRSPSSVAGLMRQADLAITGGGQTLYELAACGTPGIAVCTAANQEYQLAALSKAGSIRWAGNVADRDLEVKVKAFINEVAECQTRRDMATRGQSLVDGLGARRVAELIYGIL